MANTKEINCPNCDYVQLDTTRKLANLYRRALREGHEKRGR